MLELSTFLAVLSIPSSTLFLRLNWDFLVGMGAVLILALGVGEMRPSIGGKTSELASDPSLRSRPLRIIPPAVLVSCCMLLSNLRDSTNRDDMDPVLILAFSDKLLNAQEHCFWVSMVSAWCDRLTIRSMAWASISRVLHSLFMARLVTADTISYLDSSVRSYSSIFNMWMHLFSTM